MGVFLTWVGSCKSNCLRINMHTLYMYFTLDTPPVGTRLIGGDQHESSLTPRPNFLYRIRPRLFFMIQLMRTTLLLILGKFLWRKSLLCSSEKQNGVLCIRRPPSTFITLHGYYCDVTEQQVNFVIHCKSDCSYKGCNAYAMEEIL